MSNYLRDRAQPVIYALQRNGFYLRPIDVRPAILVAGRPACQRSHSDGPGLDADGKAHPPALRGRAHRDLCKLDELTELRRRVGRWRCTSSSLARTPTGMGATGLQSPTCSTADAGER